MFALYFLLDIPLFFSALIFSESVMVDKSFHCTDKSICHPLINSTCMGAVLNYNFTSLSKFNKSEEDIHKVLNSWSGLQYVPNCWKFLQPFLCSVYLPKCNNDNVIYPSKESCYLAYRNCRIVYQFDKWPQELDCEKFQSECEDTSFQRDQMKISDGLCHSSLFMIASNDSSNSYKETGCGIQCENPLYNNDEHQSMHLLILVCSSLCLFSSSFTFVTFLIDWNHTSRYPTLMLFFINACFIFGCLAWLVQFLPGARVDTVCKQDGTVRKAEPQINSGESLSCILVFVVIYYSSMAALMWFILLSYTWHYLFQVLTNKQEIFSDKKMYLHVAAWTVPFMLTVGCLATSQIDGDSISGICFVGLHNHIYRVGFVLAPVAIAAMIGFAFLMRGIGALFCLQSDSKKFIGNRASSKINGTIIRLGIFTMLVFSWSVITFTVHIYFFVNQQNWIHEFDDFIICKLFSKNREDCLIENRPHLIAHQLNLFAYFGAGFTMSSWVWNKSTIRIWKAFLKRILKIQNNSILPINDEDKLVLPNLYQAKRYKVSRRRSISFQSVYNDQGIPLELQSIESEEVSSQLNGSLKTYSLQKTKYVVVSRRRRYSDTDAQSIASFFQEQYVSYESVVETSEIEDVVYFKQLRKRIRKKRSKHQAMSHNSKRSNSLFDSLSDLTNVSTIPNSSKEFMKIQPQWCYKRKSILPIEDQTLFDKNKADCSVEALSLSSQLAFPEYNHNESEKLQNELSIFTISFPSKKMLDIPSNMFCLTDVEDVSSCISTENELNKSRRVKKCRQKCNNLSLTLENIQFTEHKELKMHNFYREDPVIPIQLNFSYD